MAPSACKELINKRLKEGKIKNRADGENQLSTNGAVVLGHEAGHAVLKKKDEPDGGDNVQTVENPIRKGLDEKPRLKYHKTPVPQEKDKPQKEEKKKGPRK